MDHAVCSWPIFVLCYNDTCSFTWTGEEHINQDIFECKTCGLVGTLCCCTECAFTCHRGHDCHLKRTSPTAYCDCWEKCPCKALVAGNLEQRLWLLKELISKTDAYTKYNKNGHHILYFLANTVGRQAAEQSTYKKRRQPTNAAATAENVPEYNLDPPSFAPKALDMCLQDSNVVFSLLLKDKNPYHSIKEYSDMEAVRMAQTGSDQLDMFLFVLLAKCPEQYMEKLTKLLQDEEAKRFEPCLKSKTEQENQCDRTIQAITRLVRALLRIYALISTMAPAAASTAASGIAPMNLAPPDTKRQQYHAIAMSGFLGIVRKDFGNNRDAKKKIVCSMVLRCRRVFQLFPSYAAVEGARLASSVIAPVRLGWIRNSQIPFNGKDCEALDELERMLGFKLRPIAKESKEERSKLPKQKVQPPTSSGNESGNDAGSESGSDDDDSQGGDLPSSRRLLSLSSNNGREEEETSNANNQRKMRARAIAANAEDSGDSYSSGEEESEVQAEDEEEMEEDGGDGNEEEDDDGNNEEIMEEDVDAFFGELGTGESSNEAERDHPHEDVSQRREQNTTEVSAVLSSPRTPDHSPPPHLRRSPSSTNQSREDISNDGNGEQTENDQSTRNRTTNNEEDQEGDANMEGAAENRERAGEAANESASDVGIVEEIRRRSRITASASGVFTLPNDRSRDSSYHGAIREILENKTETTIKIAQHLAEVFYVLNSLVCELLQTEEMYTRRHLPGVEIKIVESELASAWSWCNAIMDVTEAQLKYATQCAKEMGVEDPSTHFQMFTENRPRAHEYSLELMRSVGCELADSTPLLDVAQMRLLVLMADAFLIRCRAVDTINSHHKLNVIPKWELFFERPRDLSFPGLCLVSIPEKKVPVENIIPLIGRPYLLTPTSDREELFNGLPFKQSTIKNWNNIYPVSENDTPQLPEPSRFNPVNMCLGGSGDIAQQCMWKRTMDSIEKQLPGPSSEVTMIEPRKPLSDRDRIMHLLETRTTTRWRFALKLLAKEFYMDLMNVRGWEIRTSVLLREVAGYNVRQEHFRRLVNKFASQVNFNKDITFDKLCRDPAKLVRETIWQLNQQYTRRMNARSRDPPEKIDGIPVPPMVTQKVKVSFENEPGEGSGVARSFYTAIAEALMNLTELPFDDIGWNSSSEEYLYGGPPPINSQPAAERSSHMRRLQLLPRDRSGTSSSASTRRRSGGRRQMLSLAAQPYQPRDVTAAEALSSNISPEEDNGPPLEEASTIRQHSSIADRIYVMVRGIQPNAAARITGMLSDLPFTTGIMMTANNETFKNYVNDAVDMLQKSGNQDDMTLFTGEGKEEVKEPLIAQPDPVPLFYQMSPDCPFFCPCPGKMSPIRMSAFRNVGRLIGLCISQNEVLPFRLARHVLKFILDQPIDFYDLAFVDKQLYDRLDGILFGQDNVADLDLNFTTMIPALEVDRRNAFEYVLKEGGRDILVNRESCADYVKSVVMARLQRSDIVKCLQAIRSGVYDVIPLGFLECFSPEDFRLTMCGVHQVSITRMRGLTSFLEECKATAETIEKLKKWFWEVAESFNDRDKQDLIFFWTGCSSLPASDEAFVPCPTVVIRSLGDTYLPTANTCISRLYLPLYSSKKHLEAKLKHAIQIKTFGFV